MQQDRVLIQAAANHFALCQQLTQWQETVTFPTCLFLLAPGEIGDIGTEELQGIGNHPTGLTQPDDPHFQSGDLARHFIPCLLSEAVQATNQLADNILHHPFVAIIADTGHNNPPLVGIADIDIGALRRVKGTAHPDIADIRAFLQCRPFDPGGVTQKDSVRIPDTGSHLFISRGYVIVHNYFFRKILQFLFC